MKTAIAAWMIAAAANGAGQVVRLDAQQQGRAGILVRPVIERSFGDQFRVVGQVVRSPGSTVTVKSIIPGRVENVLVAPGEAVHRGQVLAEIHSHDLLSMQGRLLRTAEIQRLAETRLEAGRELFEVDGISKIDLELRRQEAFAARIEFETLREELIDHGVVPSELDQALATGEPSPHLQLTAPIDGVVLELNAQLFEWMQEYAPIMVIGDPQRVELELQIAPDFASSVSVGDAVEFVPVGRPSVTGRATVITRVPQVDQATRTVRVRARISRDQPSLYPGVFVEGSLIHGTPRTSPSVPSGAVISIGGSDTVFVRRTADTFEVRPVELGAFNGSRYEVVQGVETGEEVAAQGVFFLKSVLVRGAEGED
jgi:cobalt-zinc-cadmium efflux system membrane fusion protein